MTQPLRAEHDEMEAFSGHTKSSEDQQYFLEEMDILHHPYELFEYFFLVSDVRHVRH